MHRHTSKVSKLGERAAHPTTHIHISEELDFQFNTNIQRVCMYVCMCMYVYVCMRQVHMTFTSGTVSKRRLSQTKNVRVLRGYTICRLYGISEWIVHIDFLQPAGRAFTLPGARHGAPCPDRLFLCSATPTGLTADDQRGRQPLQHNLDDDEYGALVERYRRGKTKVLGEATTLVPLYLPHISHGLTWDRTRASMMTVRRLTT